MGSLSIISRVSYLCQETLPDPLFARSCSITQRSCIETFQNIPTALSLKAVQVRTLLPVRMSCLLNKPYPLLASRAICAYRRSPTCSIVWSDLLSVNSRVTCMVINLYLFGKISLQLLPSFACHLYSLNDETKLLMPNIIILLRVPYML